MIPVLPEITISKDTANIMRGISISGLHGTQENPIVIDCEWMDADSAGMTYRWPLKVIDSSWLVLKNLLAHNSCGCSVHIEKCSDIACENILAWDAADGNNMPWLIYRSQRIQLRDCAGWGRGRKVFQTYCCNDIDLYRCWGRWGYMTTPAPGSCGVYAPSYNTFGTRMKYCIGTVPYDPPQLVNAAWLADSMDIEPWKDQSPNCIVSKCLGVSPLARDAFHVGVKKAIYYDRCVRSTVKPISPGSDAGYLASSSNGQRVLRELHDVWWESPILSQLKTWVVDGGMWGPGDPLGDVEKLLV